MRETSSTSADQAPKAPARTRGWVRVLLAVSLAVNLAVLGLSAGAWLRHEEKGGGSRRDIGLGPLASAMTREDWKAMRPAFMALNPELGRGAAALHEEYAPLLAALRAGEFDAEALNTALAGISESNARRLAAAREVIGGYLISLDGAARAAYADRLEAALAETRSSGKKSQ